MAVAELRHYFSCLRALYSPIGFEVTLDRDTLVLKVDLEISSQEQIYDT